MDSDSFLDQEYDNLNNAILRAIVSSKDVKDILVRFKEQDHMDKKSVLNLFLSLEELHQMISEQCSKSARYKSEPNSSINSSNNEEKSSLKNKTIIDGEILTLNEALFEKFYQKKFNESNWMKKARVRF
jgi:hypothetical protein